ncbi:protein DpdE [Blastococcus sp. SYSU DS0510]
MDDLVGTLVVVRGFEHLGTGRIASVSSGMARVEWFESVAQPVTHVEVVPLGDCSRKKLVTQTRAYWRRADRWFVGRVVWGDGTRYALRLPNSEVDIPVPERELFVRWNRPVADPMDVLIAGGAESPYFRDTRIPFFANLVAQRAASGGLPSLLSSAVELYPHQLRAARQVLADPVQRYLLADEVGLGKTIEAGFVLRQYLLDTPDGSVLVIPPEELRRQWQQELRDKFFIDDFPNASIRISSHESPSAWDRQGAVGLVVVDEAHRLVDSDEVYAALRTLCLRSERLLLLSATPVLHREQQMLRLLHLLDPQMYDLDDVEGFTARVRSRHEVAMAFFALDPELSFTVPDHIATIRRAFPGDPLLANLCDRVDAAADADAQEELRRGIEHLRAHVNEAYRLHRRIIRQRREAVVGRDSCGPDSPPFEVTGRQRPSPLLLEHDAWAERDKFLETWRNAVLQDIEDGGNDPEALRTLGRVFSDLLDAGNDPLSPFGDVLRSRLSGEQSGEGVESPAALHVGPHEARVLRSVDTDMVVPAGLVAQRLLPILKHHGRTVVFAAGPVGAARLATALRERRIHVATHHHGRDAGDNEEDIQKWLNGDARVLVADATAEEGRNLQSADAVVHLSLPLSVNRLEQRLGRVDRHGAPDPARQFLVLPDDPESYAATWARTAVDGYSVFDRSLSTLQYALADLQQAQGRVLLEEGAGGLESWRAELNSTLELRRRDIAAEDMLEASFVSGEQGGQGFQRLDELEANWRVVERATDTLLASTPGSLQFAKHTPAEKPGSVAYSPGRETLVPVDLLARTTRNGSFMAPVMYNRTAALRRTGVRVARSGSVLVDALQQLVQFDDRGQAAAVWRFRKEWKGEPGVFFGLDYLVEADIAEAGRVAEESPDAMRALRRRADQLLPPFLMRLWLPAFGSSPVQDPWVLSSLEARYSPGRGGDTNLSFQRRAPLFALLNGPQGFVESCEVARTAGLAAAVRRADLEERAHAAADAARASLDRELGHLAARRNSPLLLSDGERGAMTPQLRDALVRGIARPSVGLTSVALVVLASHGWTPGDE